MLPKHHSGPSCSHKNTITSLTCKTQKHSTQQLQQRGTLMQPFHCHLQTLGCKAQKNYAQRLHQLQFLNRISTPKRKKDNDFETLFDRNLKRKIISAKIKNMAAKAHLRTSVTLRAQFKHGCTLKQRRLTPSHARARANFSPQRNLRLPQKHSASRKS